MTPAKPPKPPKPAKPAETDPGGPRLPAGLTVAGILVAVIVIVVWVISPPLRQPLVALAAVAGVIGIFPFSYIAYLGFSSVAQRERLRDDFRLLGLVQEDALTDTVDRLYQTVYSPVQFVTYIGVILLVSLLVILGYLTRDRLLILPAETMALVFYAFLGTYVFSVQELIRRYNTFDLQPQVYSSIAVRLLVSIVITAAAAALIKLSGGQLASGENGGNDPAAWAAVIAFVIGAFPSRGLRWLTQQSDKVLNASAPAESELPLRNLLGLNAWHEARFAQMGIDDAQNLATVDIRRLLLTTQFDTQQIVHWIDQSILYVKVGAKLQRYRDSKLTTFHEFEKALRELSLSPRVPLTAAVVLARVETRKRLAAALGMTDPDELDRMGDYANFPNYSHIAEYYARTTQLVRQRASQGMDLLTGALKDDNFEAAIETAQLLLDQNDNDPQLHNRLGFAYYQLSVRESVPERRAELLDLALLAYNEAIRLNENFAPALYNRSLIHVARANYAEAVKDCSSAINMDNRNAEAYNNRGLAYLKLDYLDRALGDLDEALRLDDRLGVAYLNRGVARNGRSQFEPAARDFERAYLLSVRPPELWIAWGLALIGLKEFDDAVDKLSLAVLYADKPALAYSRRGYAYLQLGPDSQRAAQLDLEAALAQPDPPLEARVNYGLLLSRLRQYDAAIAEYQKVLDAKDPNFDLVTRYNLAAAYRQLGRVDESRAQFETIIRIAPPDSVEYNDARRFLGRAATGSGSGNGNGSGSAIPAAQAQS